jgi:hypothetical protein
MDYHRHAANRQVGPGYWSLAGFAKRQVKTALTFIFEFEEAVARHARNRETHVRPDEEVVRVELE